METEASRIRSEVRAQRHIGAIIVLNLAAAAAAISYFQHYEFQAIDRPLSEADSQALRDLSTRARITATSFANSNEWGDFKGDPVKLIEH